MCRSEFQFRVLPKVDQDFVGKRVDVLFLYAIIDGDRKESEESVIWYQGDVANVFKDNAKPMVDILWDEV